MLEKIADPQPLKINIDFFYARQNILPQANLKPMLEGLEQKYMRFMAQFIGFIYKVNYMFV